MSDTEPQDARLDYIQRLLALYRGTPGVHHHVRRADRELAGQLYDNDVPLYVVAHAFILGAARRHRHNAFSSPLPPVRSLHYFLGIIQEVRERPPGREDIAACRRLLGIGDPPL